jgi:valyl-tRNA synthetase
MEARLNNESFLTKAPEAVVAKEREKLYTLKDKLEKLRQQYSRM